MNLANVGRKNLAHTPQCPNTNYRQTFLDFNIVVTDSLVFKMPYMAQEKISPSIDITTRSKSKNHVKNNF